MIYSCKTRLLFKINFNKSINYVVNYFIILAASLIITAEFGQLAFAGNNNSKNGSSKEYLYNGEEDELYGDEYSKIEEQSVDDPLYRFNYAMFSFNDKLYFWLLKPVAQGYKFITPPQLRNGFRNFFHNALFPLRFVNNIFQGKGEEAVEETKSFLINTVGGGFGFATPAQYVFGIKNYDEDMGQTFGHYSIKEGFYLVLPIIGPTTLRDCIGAFGDFFLSPTSYIESTELALGIGALDQINSISFRIGDYETLKDAALDPYVALRNGYIQMRRKQITE